MGFENDRAVLWQVFSHVVKSHVTLKLDGNRTNETVLYNFHESIFDALRPALTEGVRSIILTAPMKTTYATDFLNHVRKHHAYLTQSKNPNRAAFAVIIGSADKPDKVAELVKTKEFRSIVTETTSEEADTLIDALEKHLSDSNAVTLFSLKEIEDVVYAREGRERVGTEYLMLTDKYLADSKEKNRIQRLLQIVKNKQVKTRMVDAETPAGKRISQFGGIVFFAHKQLLTAHQNSRADSTFKSK